MTSSVFPDLNVWIAMTLDAHEHHESAKIWYESLPQSTSLVFCRFTQLGFLRLLNTVGATGRQVMTQREAWRSFDAWMERGGAIFEDEPIGLEVEFRRFSSQKLPAPKDWANSYLAAFAQASGMQLVTFDRALSLRSAASLLLT
jgi:toxin-antitoxin system PIN domain toxin